MRDRKIEQDSKEKKKSVRESRSSNRKLANMHRQKKGYERK